MARGVSMLKFLLIDDNNFEGLWVIKIYSAAARTKNYSGAEIEGVVKSAVSYALNRQLSLDDLTKPVDEESIKVTMDDFLNAVQEIVPAFGASTDDLERCRLYYELSFVIIFFEINVISNKQIITREDDQSLWENTRTCGRINASEYFKENLMPKFDYLWKFASKARLMGFMDERNERIFELKATVFPTFLGVLYC